MAASIEKLTMHTPSEKALSCDQTGCLDHAELARYLFDDAMPLEASRQIEVHIECCPSCERILGALANDENDSAGVEPRDAALLAALQRLGQYRQMSKIGEGGFGVVYRAWDSKLRKHVAIKMSRTPSDDVLLHDAQAVARLDHPHIVKVLHVGTCDDGRIFVVSEYIDGVTLKTLLRSERMSFSRSARICAMIASALHHAHKNGVYHRDIKPSNIMIDHSGHAWLLDFGLGVVDDHVPDSARNGATLAYQSPEQVLRRGTMIDGRSDIFCLGIVLYEMLTGMNPFVAKSVSEVHHRITEVDAAPPRERDEAIPRSLDEICRKALRRAPVDRIATAFDFAESLEQASTYTPTPIDVSQVSFPSQLESLVEHLSRHNHDIWAQQRIRDGWQVGDRRDDRLKLHPDLVPYHELTEATKEYDRLTVINTIKAMISLGFEVRQTGK